ncbi:MAG TPA: recombinase family protein [Streptosporangiaceae bacterium]
MAEQAGIWQRVSTGGQDEASQLPDLIKWCDSHSYEYDLDERYVLHGKSASKGRQDAYLDRVIRDMEDGKITVLVVWQSSRIERRGAYSVFDLARRVREAGGRIEYVKDAYLNDANEMSDVMLALAATKDRQKSRDISEQVTAKQAALRAAGSVVGRAPWGYRIVCRDFPGCTGLRCGHVKVLTPTDIGRKYIPLIFERVIAGDSLRTIAAWLTAEGVPTNSGNAVWHEGFIGNRLIKNRTYMGQRPNAGLLETEALVSPTTWQQANASLASRIRPGRGTVVHVKPLVSSICGACYGEIRDGCPSGKSPMYRVSIQYADGKRAFYRCTGHGPQRKGCGAPMLAVDVLDAMVTDVMLDDGEKHEERVFAAGDDKSDEIMRLREIGAVAMRKGDYNAATDAMRKATQIEDANKDRVQPGWTWQYVGPCADVADEVLLENHELCGHQTEGDYYASLSGDERREYLRQFEIRAERTSDLGPVVDIRRRDISDPWLPVSG